MVIGDLDWAALANEIGSTNSAEERGGHDYAQRALEIIIGESNIRSAVSVIIDWKPGSGLARSVLRYIHSTIALEAAYHEYKFGERENAASAVGLIKDICHPQSLNWVEEFLLDDDIAIWGIGVLDQLIWSHVVIPEEPSVARLLAMAESHHDENVRRATTFIRDYLEKRRPVPQ